MRLDQFHELEAAFKAGDLAAARARFDSFFSSFWDGHSDRDLMGMDLSELAALHAELLPRAAALVRAEEDGESAAILESTRDALYALGRVAPGRGAHGIRCLGRPQRSFVIGDLHADDESLAAALDAAGLWDRAEAGEDFRLVFLGDYVDRGARLLKTLERVLVLKLLFPRHITLLRGNHDTGRVEEDGSISMGCGIPASDDPLDYFPRYLEALARDNPSFPGALLHAYFSFFDSLPYLAFVEAGGRAYQCVHGGLPRPWAGSHPGAAAQSGALMPPDAEAERYREGRGCYDHLASLSSLTAHPDADSAGAAIRHNLMWSDPARDGGELRLDRKRFAFTDGQYAEYRRRFNLEGLFRGHEGEEDGFREHFDGSLRTVFSTGASPDSHYVWVRPKIAELSAYGGIRFLPLGQES